MNTEHRTILIGLIVIVCFFVISGLAGCRSTQAVTPAQPTLTLDQTSAKEFVIDDFDAVHSPVEGDSSQYLVLGNLPISQPAADLPPEISMLLGRWEGYSYAPPVKKDQKIVMVIQEINQREGKLVGWSGANLQYPTRLGEIHFRVVQGDPPSIEFLTAYPDGTTELNKFSYDKSQEILKGWVEISAKNFTYGPFELKRENKFVIYKDYPGYLSEKRIRAIDYQNSALQHYGKGYLLYLPEGYEEQPEKTWPLIFFLHGSGDRGDNIYLLAKASPFMYIREKSSLPFIIAAPLLSANEGYSGFPDEYLNGALAEILANYRVDETRLYLTGLSMGGEATYRFAVQQPDTFAAVVPLAAFVNSETYSDLERIKDLPVWAIHGSNDIIFPVAKGQQPADALKALGGNIQFTVLPDHDHDVWTDTYSYSAFYDWLLQHQR